MNNDLHAKALRAAEWAKENSPYLYEHLSYDENKKWILPGEDPPEHGKRTDRILIAFCEDRGWIDTAELHIPTEEEAPDICLEMMGQFMNELDTAEDEGVATELSITIKPVPSGWEWKLLEAGCVCTAFGQEPTRAEARRAALEAARGLG